MKPGAPEYSGLARVTVALFGLNVALQVLDGVVTYVGCSTGMAEGNPLVAYAMESLGLGLGLVLTKTTATVFLGSLWVLRKNRYVPAALAVTAGIYIAFSAVPWSVTLLLSTGPA